MTPLRRILAEKRRLILPLALAAGANVLLFMLLVFPLGRQVASAEVESQQQRELLRNARQDAASARATVQGKQQADVSLRKFYQDVLPANASAARGITYRRLSQLARESNLRLERGTNEPKREKDSTLEKITTTYTLSGDYRDVRRFIYALETSPEFMVLENVALTAPSDERERGLSVRLDVATYYRANNAG
jgi:type IV pilus assembly protein PilO